MVRLKEDATDLVSLVEYKFQFQDGTIKSR